MISTFLPAQALRTSRKTGGLNSRPSCAWAYCWVLSRSRPGDARGFEAFRVRATYFARRMLGSCRSPRATTSRARCAETAMWEGHCCLHGPSHQGSSPRLSPWLRPSANVSRLEAPFCCCFMARARATLNEQCQPSEGEALSAWSLGGEASRAVLGIPPRTTRARPNALG